MAHDIDYDKLRGNVEQMIDLLEYDSMRSAGKCKMNSQHLHSLYYLKEKYDAMKKPAVKHTQPKKEG